MQRRQGDTMKSRHSRQDEGGSQSSISEPFCLLGEDTSYDKDVVTIRFGSHQ
jgi:hypothetical protein